MAWQTIPGTGDLLQKSGDVHRAGVVEVGTLTGFNPGSAFTLSSPMDVASHRITSVPEPILDHHAASKVYVDDVATGKDLSNLPSRTESGATGDLTIDISSDSIIELEPEGDINANFVGLSASPTQRTIAYLTLIDTSSHSLTFTVNSEKGKYKWLSNSIVAEPKSHDITGLDKINTKTSDISNNPSGLVLNPGGGSPEQFMVIVERNSGTLKRYFLPTPKSTKNASLHQTKDISSDANIPSDIDVRGTAAVGDFHLLVTDERSNTILEYKVDNDFNFDTATLFQINDVNSFGTPVGITSLPGSQVNVFMLNNSSGIFELGYGTEAQGMTSPVSLASQNSVTKENTKGIQTNPNRDRLFITTSQFVFHYKLTTANCLDSLQEEQEFNASSDIDNFIRGISSSEDGDKFYLSDDNNKIIEYLNKTPKFVKLIQRGEDSLYAYEE